jgi:hypothetical protein
MEQPDWFTEKWATEVRDSTRRLVRLYAEAIETVDALPHWFRMIRLSGIRGGARPLFIFKALLRDSVADHIRRVLQQTVRLQVRAFVASRPLPEQTRLGVKKTAPPEAITRATEARDKFIAQQQIIAGLLDEASKDVKGMLELVGANEGVGQRAFKNLIRTARRFLPFLWASVVIAQFSRWSGQSQLQLLAFFVGTVVVYHLAAWLTLPFHDAGETKYVYFEGYIGGGDDGLRALFPPASRYESALFKLFRSKPPIAISWETVTPLLHYALISALLIIMLIKLPFAGQALNVALSFAAILIIIYIWQLWLLWHLLTLRYEGRSAWEIITALISSLTVLNPSDKSDDSEDAADSDDGKKE